MTSLGAGRLTAAVLTVVLAAAGCGPAPPAAPPAAAPTAAPATAVPADPAPPTPGEPGGAPTGPASRAPAPDPPAGVPAALRGTEWDRLPTARRVVALTFDAGGDAAAVDPILATLAREGVPATFFLTGRWTRAHPDQARRIAAAHPVGNHTDTHPHLPALPDAAVTVELEQAAAAITDVTGRDPRPLFRFPFGDRDGRTIALVNAAGYGSIRWTVDTTGWRGTSGGMSVPAVTDRVLAALRPGAIVLMHVGAHPTDGSTLDADALPGLVREIRARGYGFVAVGESW